MVILDERNEVLKELEFEQPTAWLATQLERDQNLWNRNWVIGQLAVRREDAAAMAALARAAGGSDYFHTRARAALAPWPGIRRAVPVGFSNVGDAVTSGRNGDVNARMALFRISCEPAPSTTFSGLALFSPAIVSTSGASRRPSSGRSGGSRSAKGASSRRWWGPTGANGAERSSRRMGWSTAWERPGSGRASPASGR